MRYTFQNMHSTHAFINDRFGLQMSPSRKHFLDCLIKASGSRSVRPYLKTCYRKNDHRPFRTKHPPTLSVFFFPRENQKCPWKPFFALFAIFFTGGNSFSRPLFWTFSRVVQGFHGQYLINFHGRNFYFHGRNAENFHGRIFFFTGRILDQCYALNPPTPLFAAVFT